MVFNYKKGWMVKSELFILRKVFTQKINMKNIVMEKIILMNNIPYNLIFT